MPKVIKLKQKTANFVLELHVVSVISMVARDVCRNKESDDES